MIFGIQTDATLWQYVIFPVVIFTARVVDVSCGTLRIILLAKGRRILPAVIGFFEVLIWVLVIAHLVRYMHSWMGYIAYAAGFATGTYIGAIIGKKRSDLATVSSMAHLQNVFFKK